MQVNGVDYSRQSFRGGVATAFKNVTDSIKTTAKTTSDIADLVSTASLAVDSPDVAAVKVLNEKLDDFSQSKKTPKPLKVALKVVCGVITTGLTFVITKNALSGKGKIVDTAKNFLNKTDVGKSVVKAGASIRDCFASIGKVIDTSRPLTFIKGRLSSARKFVSEMLDKRLPSVKPTIDNFLTKTKLKDWSTKNYFINGVSAYFAALQAKKFIKTGDTKVDDITESLMPEAKSDDEPEINAKEAA